MNEGKMSEYELTKTLEAMVGVAYWSAFLAGGAEHAHVRGKADMRVIMMESLAQVGLDYEKGFDQEPTYANRAAKAMAAFCRRVADYLEAHS